MAGVFTDISPTSHGFLHTKPVPGVNSGIRFSRSACQERQPFAAINVEPMDGKLKVGVCVTEPFAKAKHPLLECMVGRYQVTNIFEDSVPTTRDEELCFCKRLCHTDAYF